MRVPRRWPGSTPTRTLASRPLKLFVASDTTFSRPPRAGHAGQRASDEDVLAFATATGRTVVTFDRRDFIRLHGRVADHAGIIVCTADNDFEGLAGRVHGAIDGAPDLSGQLLRICRPW